MNGIQKIAVERERQIIEKGFTTKHDSEYDCFELSKAAIAYIHHATYLWKCVWQVTEGRKILPYTWPATWHEKAWKPEPQNSDSDSPMIEISDSIRMLEKAGALIAAEIDRLEDLES